MERCVNVSNNPLGRLRWRTIRGGALVLPVLGVGAEDYKTEEACINANAGTNDTFWCVTRNWLDKSQRKPVRAFVTD